MGNKFNLFDVVIIKNHSLVPTGTIGTICNVEDACHGVYGVELFKKIGLHTCNRHCELGYGINCSVEKLELCYENNEKSLLDFDNNDFEEFLQ